MENSLMYASDKYGQVYPQHIHNNYESLVLSGGALKGTYLLGFLQSLPRTITFNKYFGTSSGAIICFLHSLGFAPYFIFKSLLKYNLLPIHIHDGGIFNHNIIFKIVKDLLWTKYRLKDITFNEHFSLTDKLLVITTYNVTDCKGVQLSIHSTPDLSIIKALRMSSSIPILFKPEYHNNKLYTDGMVYDNFPIKTAIEYTTKGGTVLCLTTINSRYAKDKVRFYHNKRLTIAMVNDSDDFVPYILSTTEAKIFMFRKGSAEAERLFKIKCGRRRRNSF